MTLPLLQRTALRQGHLYSLLEAINGPYLTGGCLLLASSWSENLTAEKAAAAGAEHVRKDELFRQSDVLAIHLVLGQRSRGLVGAAELALMKPTAWLVNTSRGPIVEDSALISALREHRIGGAAVDVFDIEPLPADHPYRSLDNMLATPHIGYVSLNLYRAFYGDTVKNIVAWLDGSPFPTAGAS
jgi:phosphoglycerate dehydrogenase-like enzyme